MNTGQPISCQSAYQYMHIQQEVAVQRSAERTRYVILCLACCETSPILARRTCECIHQDRTCISCGLLTTYPGQCTTLNQAHSITKVKRLRFLDHGLHLPTDARQVASCRPAGLKSFRRAPSMIHAAAKIYVENKFNDSKNDLIAHDALDSSPGAHTG